MRAFSEMAKEFPVRYPTRQAIWTDYHLETNPFKEYARAWGVCMAYHFDQGVSFQSWIQLVEQVKKWIESRSKLEEIIKFERFYEIGEDFFLQEKPPYDGGYSASMYEEFLYHRSCEPAPWFWRQIARLHRRVAGALRSLRNGPKDELIARIIHATFIKPYSHLFWRDDEGWAVYWPNIGVDDVREWERLSAT